jgi:hypothetical protein
MYKRSTNAVVAGSAVYREERCYWILSQQAEGPLQAIGRAVVLRLEGREEGEDIGQQTCPSSRDKFQHTTNTQRERRDGQHGPIGD